MMTRTQGVMKVKWMGLKPARGRKERDSVILMKVVVVMIKRRKMR